MASSQSQFPSHIFRPLNKRLGKGSFAVVDLFETNPEYRDKFPEQVAIKHIDFSRHKANVGRIRKSVRHEIDILLSLKDEPNILRLYEVFGDPMKDMHLYLVCEYCKGGTLDELVRRNRFIPERTAKKFLQQLACGLYSLYSHGIIHRDLKPQNLFFSDGERVLKIGDFGFAKKLEKMDLAQTHAGTPLYMAPEVIFSSKNGYDFKADIYSVGAIFYFMLEGTNPIHARNMNDLKMKLKVSTLPLKNVRCSEEARQLLEGLLNRQGKDRMTHESFFRHPFIGMEICSDGSIRFGDTLARQSDQKTSEDGVDLSMSVMSTPARANSRPQVSLRSLFNQKSFAYFPFHDKTTLLDLTQSPMNNSSQYQRKVIKTMERDLALAWIFGEYAVFIYKYGELLSSMIATTFTLKYIGNLSNSINKEKQEIRLEDSPRISAIQNKLKEMRNDLKHIASRVLDDPRLSWERNEECGPHELLYLYAQNLGHEAAFNDSMNMSHNEIEPIYWRAEMIFAYLKRHAKNSTEEEKFEVRHNKTANLRQRFLNKSRT